MKRQSKWILILYLALSVSNCQDIVDQKCQLACEKFVSCTEEELKLTLSPDVKRTGRIQCMDGCTTHNSDILQCFDQEPNSCKGFGGQARLAAPPHAPFNLFALTFLNLVFQILNVGLGGVFPMFAVAIPWSHNKQPKGVKRWWMIKKLDTFLSL